MSFESKFGARLCAREAELAQKARLAETASSSDGDGSSRIDPSTSTKGQRPAPDGLVIHLDERSEAALSDTSWQDEYGTHFEEVLRLSSEFNGNHVEHYMVTLLWRKILQMELQ